MFKDTSYKAIEPADGAPPKSPADGHPQRENNLLSIVSADRSRLASVDTSLPAAGAGKPGISEAIANATCPDSPSYTEILTTYFQNSFNVVPAALRENMLHQYNCQIHSENDAVNMANLSLNPVADRFSYAMTREEYARSQTFLAGYYVGGGLRLTAAPIGSDGMPILPKTLAAADLLAYKPGPNMETIIFSTVPNGPARVAGLQKGDIIKAVDGVDTSGKLVYDVADSLGGPENTHHHLTVLRNGATIDTDISRQKIVVPSMEQPKDLGNGITYIRINDFDEHTAEELQSVLEKDGAKAFVVDVRNDPGGILDTAIDAASLFIEKGTIATVEQREPSDPDHPQYSTVTYSVDKKESHRVETRKSGDFQMTDERKPYLTAGKFVVVLTNDGTASGAELFSGAAHDSGGATTVGGPTYGKGIGQVIKKLSDGKAVKITELQYRTPSGIWPGDAGNNIHSLQPDVLVENPAGVEFGSKDDKQLNTGVNILLAKLEKKG